MPGGALLFAVWPARMAPLLIEAGWKSFVLLAMAAAAAFCLRRVSAATRHNIWFLAIAGLLFLPFFCALPHWRILPQWLNRATPAPLFNPDPSAQSAPKAPAIFARSSLIARARTQSVNSAITITPDPMPHGNAGANSPAAFDFSSWLIVSWLAGAFFVLLARLCGILGLGRLARRSEPVTDDGSLRMLQELSRSLTGGPPVILLKTSRRHMPMTWGMFRPKVLLPEEAWKWPREKLRGVLLHELAHVKRGDYLSNLLAQFVCALYWFNPLAWLAVRRMLAERERACDDIVLNEGIEPENYAEDLLEMAARIPVAGLASRAAIPMARHSSLEGRLIAILDADQSRASAAPQALVAAGILIFGCFAAVAMVSTRMDQPGLQNAESVGKGFLARALAFSPVIERSLPSQKTGNGTPYLHFQKGDIIIAPPDPRPPSRPVTNEWMTRDVTISAGPAGPVLRGRGCAFARVDAGRWDTIPPETVVSELSASDLPDNAPLPGNGKGNGVYLFKTRENTMGILQVAGGQPEKSGLVKIQYKLVQPEAHPALGSRRVSSPLINIDFCFGDETLEAGPAAVGQNPDDFWNAFDCSKGHNIPRPGGTARGLKLADRTVTSVSVTVSNAPGDFANGSDDIMYHGFMYKPDGEPVTVTINGLPEGLYDFYIYTHDGNDLIEAGGITYPANGPATSFDWPVSNPIIWQEGRQYVLIRKVQVAAGKPVTLNALPGRQKIAPLSGMQIVKAN